MPYDILSKLSFSMVYSMVSLEQYNTVQVYTNQYNIVQT